MKKIIIIFSFIVGAFVSVRQPIMGEENTEVWDQSIENTGDYIFNNEFKVVTNISDDDTVEKFKNSFSNEIKIKILKIEKKENTEEILEIEVMEGIIQEGYTIRIETEIGSIDYQVINNDIYSQLTTNKAKTFKATSFTPRLTTAGMSGNPYWYSGLNPFYSAGLGLPNCTAYAFGRLLELNGGINVGLPRGHAGTWYNNTVIPKGSEPRLGAVMVFTGGKFGHVSVVEEVYPNGDIKCSNSNYGGDYFFTTYHTKASGYNNYFTDVWFQGFIYAYSGEESTTKPTPPKVVEQQPGAKDGIKDSISYRSYVAFKGWQVPVDSGQVSGTVGGSYRLEALNIDTSKIPGLVVNVSTHSVGDTAWVAKNNINKDTLIGTTGQSKAINAIKISTNRHAGFKLQYRVHIGFRGWSNWTEEDVMAGTADGNQIEAIQIRLANDNDQTASFPYRSHVSTKGWEKDFVNQGVISGTTGQKVGIEALQVDTSGVSGLTVTAKTHGLKSTSWTTKEITNAETVIGSTGEWNALNAINLTTNKKGFKLYYSAHVAFHGWTPWVAEGTTVGSDISTNQIEAIKIRLVRDSSNDVGINYSAHNAFVGWGSTVINGQQAGVVGKSYGLEALKINTTNVNAKGITLDVETHSKGESWEVHKNVKNGQILGVTGKSKPLDGIKITVKGTPGYKVYYQVHTAWIGWSEWYQDGEIAGKINQTDRKIEAIRIRIVKE